MLSNLHCVKQGSNREPRWVGTALSYPAFSHRLTTAAAMLLSHVGCATAHIQLGYVVRTFELAEVLLQ
jgi:hypothetical protein